MPETIDKLVELYKCVSQKDCEHATKEGYCGVLYDRRQ